MCREINNHVQKRIVEPLYRTPREIITVLNHAPHLHTENPIYVFPEMKRRGLVPNSYIRVRYLWAIYIFPGPILGMQKSLTDPWMWQFHFWEYINWNQSFILDSHRPFICSVWKEPLCKKMSECAVNELLKHWESCREMTWLRRKLDSPTWRYLIFLTLCACILLLGFVSVFSTLILMFIPQST
jgi:hypothetical protein